VQQTLNAPNAFTTLNQTYVRPAENPGLIFHRLRKRFSPVKITRQRGCDTAHRFGRHRKLDGPQDSDQRPARVNAFS